MLGPFGSYKKIAAGEVKGGSVVFRQMKNHPEAFQRLGIVRWMEFDLFGNQVTLVVDHGPGREREFVPFGVQDPVWVAV